MKKSKGVNADVKDLCSVRYHLDDRTVIAWTDGACEPNPGAGGWGLLLIDGKETYEAFGGSPETTNNRMEMEAVLQAIKITPRYKRLIIRTDSQLVMLCAIKRWKRKSNLDQWAEYDAITKFREVLFEWYRSHNGTEGNERADYLAAQGRLSVI